MKTIVLDTNFLLIPWQFKVDIFDEIERVCRFPYELKVVKGTIDELKHLQEKGDSKEKKAAKFALSLVKQYNIGTLDAELGDVDSTIASLSNGTIVGTQDHGLKLRLKGKGISLLVLRQQKYLQLIKVD
jgi:uncharacterized protein